MYAFSSIVQCPFVYLTTRPSIPHSLIPPSACSSGRLSVCSFLPQSPLLPSLRFVHELQRVHSTTTDRCNQVAAALKCVRQARERAEALERKVGRERVVLEEKCEVCEQLLVQVGQDTAISQEHSKLASKQRSRIAHLRKVSSMNVGTHTHNLPHR